MKILLVDDSKTMRMIVKRTVGQAGLGQHEFLEAGNGMDAFNLLKTEEVDLIMCDWNMPVMNGINLLKKLKETGSKVPFGFVTSEGTEDMRSEAKTHGASFYLVKPFTAEDFKNELQSVVK